MYVNQVPVQVGSCASFSSSPSLRTPYLLRIIVSSFSSLFLPSIDVGITKIQTFIPSRHSYPYSFWHSQQKSEYLCSTIMMKWTHFTVSSASKLSPRSSRPCAAASTILSTRSHYSYASPGHFHGVGNNNNSDTTYHRHDWKQRGFTVGIGGPVGSGKTALVLALTKRLAEKVPRKSKRRKHQGLALVVDCAYMRAHDAHHHYRNVFSSCFSRCRDKRHFYTRRCPILDQK